MVAVAAVLTPFGWLAAPLMKMLFDKVHDHLGTDMDEKMKILADTVLPRLFLVIEKAEKSPDKEKLVNWLNKLKGAYYDAEDAIDLFEYELLEQKVTDDRKTLEQKEKSKTRTRISLPSSILPKKLKDSFSKKKIKLNDCMDKLIEIGKEANEFRDLLEAQENGSCSDSSRETFSVNYDGIFGRDVDKENIVRLLTEKHFNSGPAIPIVIKNMIEIIVGLFMKKHLNSEPRPRSRPVIPIVIKNIIEIIVGVLMKKPSNYEPGPSTKPAIPIIAITGRSGVGKTALAQYVYKHMDKPEHFDLCVWVYTRRKFKATDVMKNMIEIIKAKEGARNDNPFTPLEALSTQLRIMLGSKKLLLVLDDFWCDTEDFVDQWKKFTGCLSSCSPGSRILLTTQFKNVAEKANLPGVTEVKTYYLKEMEEDQFLELFMHYAWHSNSHLQKEEFKKIGRKIVVKLKGDPGAAKLVGQQLWEKNLRYWEVVAEKDWLGDNMKAKIWSYQQLPQNLQRCFAICCLFPKGTMTTKKVLINFWMAEGFITPIDKHERLEDTGENYLDELVSRFFIEKVGVGKENRYQLHDLLHDLAERVQGDDFIRIDSTNSRDVSSHIKGKICENIRHILLPSSMINELKENICRMKNIRTFWVKHVGGIVPINVLQDILKHLGKLRVLYLFDCVDDLPDSIYKLKHLRYLSINGYQPLKKIPDSICKLYHLQNLDLKNCESLPKYFCELISLRVFDASRETISHISHVGRLTSLQKLDHFVVRKECGYELQQLENLNQLRGEMHIAGLENVGSKDDAVKAHMQNKKYLEALTFEWNSDERDTNDVAGLCAQHVKLLEALQPQHNISDLTLKGFGGDKFPSWLLSKNSLNHLTSLALMCCDKIENISSIEESLPNCRSLILQRLNNLKEMPSLPPNLTYLEIDDLPQLSYFSEDDLLMNVEASREVIKRIEEFWLKSEEKYYFYKVMTQVNKCLAEVLQKITIILNHKADISSKKEEIYESKLVLPSSITILKISSCTIATDALSICIQSLVSLSKLELSNIKTITSLPPKEVLCSLKNLQSLTIINCFLLGSLGGIGDLTSLIELTLSGCITPNILNDSLPSSLERLTFDNWSNVEVLLAKSYLPVLHALSVYNFDLKNQMGVLHVGDLSYLSSLTIVGWNGYLEGLNSLTALNFLHVRNCPEINLSSPLAKYASALPWVGVDNLLVLKLILSNETISSVESLVIFSLQGDSLDDEILQSLTSLKCLYISHSSITHLPENLKNLASLQSMGLLECPNLCEFELEELPKNLRQLRIQNCPNLTEKLNKGGPYWVSWFSEENNIIVRFSQKEEGNRF